MKSIIYVIFLMFLTNCSSNKITYVCGDHDCINKKEKEDYFKKTMIVEIKINKNNKEKNVTEIEEIKKRSKKEEAKRIDGEKVLYKQEKINQKIKKEEEKILIKQNKLNEKRLKKEKKDLIKQNKLKEKQLKKEEDALAKSLEKDEKQFKKKKKKTLIKKSSEIKKIKDLNKNQEINLIKTKKISSFISDPKTSSFEQIMKKIYKKNNLKPYPDINNILE